jgi:serine/threonine protein kinase
MKLAFYSSNQPPAVALPVPQPLEAASDLGSAVQSDEDVRHIQNTAEQSQPTPTNLFNNRFEIIRRLGKGGFGTTYLAQDKSTPQPLLCVIKQLRYQIQPGLQPGLQPGHREQKTSIYSRAKIAIDQERTKRRFQRETRMMARLGRHNQLPCLLDHFTDNNQFYLVQEHVPGHTLSREIGLSGPQGEPQVKQFLREMIPIIRYIHRQNLLHLDIKPSNIMRRSSDRKLVLIDFGAVRRYAPKEELREAMGVSERGDRTTGTLGFSPSEQLAAQPTYASDIYALGVTCLYLLTKISPIDLATSARGQNLRWQESVSLSEHFTSILGKMLHPEAARRYQDTYELERALNLENHYETLKTCLTTEPMTDKTFAPPATCSILSPNGYADEPTSQSLAQRQANAIRQWQQRRRQFKTFTPR